MGLQLATFYRKRSPADTTGAALGRALDAGRQAARSEGPLDLAAVGAPPVSALPPGILDAAAVRAAGGAGGGGGVWGGWGQGEGRGMQGEARGWHGG